jgi:hypothetical protein
MNSTDRGIIERANELARDFYAMMGYRQPLGYRFDQATHPQERLCWEMVRLAYEVLKKTNLDDVLVSLED